MKTFFFKTPGGYEVEARANDQEAALDIVRDNWQTMPRIIMRDGSSRVLESSDGKRMFVSPGGAFTDAARIDQVLQGSDPGKLVRDAWDRDIIAQAPTAARVNQFLRGLPAVGSFVDEALGAVAGDDAKTAARASAGAMTRQRPIESAALQLGGAVTSLPVVAAGAGAAGMGTALSRTADFAARGSRLARVGKGAAIGAGLGGAEGAVYGAGEGQGGISDRAGAAATGAGLGAGFGGLLGGAAPIVGDIAGNVWNSLFRSEESKIAAQLGISKEAAAVIKTVGLDGGDAGDALRRIEQAGERGMLADASEASRALLDAVTKGDLGAADVAKRRVDARAVQSKGLLSDAMDAAMGAPQSAARSQAGIRAATQGQRNDLYNQALTQEIDWRSPAGERLDALLQTTPPEAMREAQKAMGLRSRADILPDYSGEFADRVTSASNLTDEAREIDSFFSAYRDVAANQTRRPMSALVKTFGGISPDGRAAEELRAMGVTSRTHPALFRRGGLDRLDNLEIGIFPDTFALRSADETGNYANEEAVLRALADEQSGARVMSAEDQADVAIMSEFEQMLPEMEARRAALDAQRQFSTAPQEVSDAFPVRTIEEADQIKRALDDMQRREGAGLMGGTTQRARDLSQRSREIRDALTDMSPAYKDALAAGSDTISRVQAVEFGSELLQRATTRDSVSDFIQQAGPGDMAAARQGLRGAIDEIMANVGAVASDPNVDARTVSETLRRLSSPAARQKIADVLGDDAGAVFRALDEASVAIQLRAGIAENSKTAIRQSTDQMIGRVTRPGVIGTAARGEAVNTAKEFTRMLTGLTSEFDARQKSAIYRDIAEVLTRQDTKQSRDALRLVDKMRNSQKLTEQERSFLARVVSGVSGAVTGGLLGRGVAQEESQ